jgi:hypothetical protein
MTRRTTQTFHGFGQPEVIVTLPDDHDHPGEHRGELRAWALDDETGDWWGLCQYRVAVSEQMLGWIHESQLRRAADLTDDDGLVDPDRVVALPQRDT